MSSWTQSKGTKPIEVPEITSLEDVKILNLIAKSKWSIGEKMDGTAVLSLRNKDLLKSLYKYKDLDPENATYRFFTTHNIEHDVAEDAIDSNFNSDTKPCLIISGFDSVRKLAVMTAADNPIANMLRAQEERLMAAQQQDKGGRITQQ